MKNELNFDQTVIKPIVQTLKILFPNILLSFIKNGTIKSSLRKQLNAKTTKQE